MEELALYKCMEGPRDHGGHMGHGGHGGHHHLGAGRQCLVRGDGETSLIRNGGRGMMEENPRCPLIPHKVKRLDIYIFPLYLECIHLLYIYNVHT